MSNLIDRTRKYINNYAMSTEEFNKQILAHPTPRTDNEYGRILAEVGENFAALVDMCLLARKLERELIAAQNEIKNLKARLARGTDE